MQPIVTPHHMRLVDERASEPIDVLIERAGRRLAWTARDMLGGVYGRRVVAIAGPGNNGADARVGARVLRRWGVRVTIVDPAERVLPACDLVIDAAFGTGVNRDFEPPQLTAKPLVLAADIASGIDGLTGEIHGAALPANRTLTFAALKPGLLLDPGARYSGTLEVAGLGLDVCDATAWLFAKSDARELVPRRSRTDHKWRRAVMVIGGSAGMLGAPTLAAQAALRAGAGIVHCRLPGVEVPGQISEVVLSALPKDWSYQALADAARFHAVVVGPGLGRAEHQPRELWALLTGISDDTPVVIDGDGLRALGERPTLRPNVVLTPHDGEFSALFGAAPGADRFESARSLAAATNATVLLKGPLTIVASPDGRCIASNRGDERLATAGSGDVLAGCLGAILAGGVLPLEAAALAAWLHGDACRSQPVGGMRASDLLDGLTQSLGEVLASHWRDSGGFHASN